MRVRLSLVFLAFSGCAFGQLTPDQKQADFLDTVALYTKHYGPYEWKRDAIGFDLRNVQPWLTRISATTNDLDFYETMVEFVAGLQDTHDHYTLPSNFSAGFGLAVDIYDGKVLIDSITRSRLPSATYPISIGDEIVSIDGVPVLSLIPQFAPYVQQANARSTQRLAANAIFNRFQSSNPFAAQVPEKSVLVLNKLDGSTITVTVPWGRSGLPLTSIDPVLSPSLSTSLLPARTDAAAWGATEHAITAPKRPLPRSISAEPQDSALANLQTSEARIDDGTLGIGSLTSVFNPPPGFTLRLGSKITDMFLSGTFPSAGKTLGFIRIGTYNPADTTVALQQFAAEMLYFQQNVDGVVIDQMRNNGGLLCYGEAIASYLMPATFRPLGYEIRVTREYLQSFYNNLQSSIALGSSQTVIDQYQVLFNALQTAYTNNSPRTDAVPLCTSSFDRQPPKNSTGAVVSYTKPLVFLIDEFSLSTADSVPAIIQDNGRGKLVGYRTNGAGGSNSLNTSSWNAGAYSEGTVGITLSLMVRKDPVITSDYPSTKYVENVGVRPDVMVDYMTRENLLNTGQTFLNAAVAVLMDQIAAAAK